MRLLPAACGVLLAALSGAASGNGTDAALGRKVFTEIAEPPCALCHALKAAGAAGKLGPSLDELQPDAQRALRAVRDGVGIMPAYAGRLTQEQMKAVSEYVAGESGFER